MDSKRKILRSFLAMTAIVLLIHFGCSLFFGTNLLRILTIAYSRQRIRARLAAAMEKWEQHQVREYEIEVRYLRNPHIAILEGACIKPDPFLLHVRDNSVVEAHGYSLEDCKENFGALTVNGLFAWTASLVDDWHNGYAGKIRVHFDSEWGYVTKLEAINTIPPWLAPGHDASYSVEILGFRPLP